MPLQIALKSPGQVVFWKKFPVLVTSGSLAATINYMVAFRTIGFGVLLLAIACASCSKDGTPAPPSPPGGFKLSYGDSVLYTQNQATDYIVPVVQQPSVAGTYSAFPEGIDINTQTGAINVSKSEIGLRYRISFAPAGSTDSIHTVVLLAGINYLDGFYLLNTADSILRPVYNGTVGNKVPGLSNGTVFDEGSGCNSAGCNVNTNDGTINLAQTVRNGVFGTVPQDNARQEFTMNYRINDKSGKALNTLKVKLYYYKSKNNIAQEAYDIIASRDGTVFRTAGDLSGIALRTFNVNKAAKPRPPCIFIVAQ